MLKRPLLFVLQSFHHHLFFCKTSCVSFTFFLLISSALTCHLTLDKIECFMQKLVSAMRSEIFSKLRFFARWGPQTINYCTAWLLRPLKSQRYRRKKEKMFKALQNWRETRPCNFMSLNITYKIFRFFLSNLDSVFPSGTINKPFVKYSLPF